MFQSKFNTTRRRVFSNAGALAIIQAANLLLPLLLIPYLARTLGVEQYGIFSFALSLVQVSYILTDYGFSLSATQTISRHRHNKRFVNRVIGAVFLSKTPLLATCLIALTIYAFYNEKYAEHTALLWTMSLAIIGITFQPTWFFQGIEKMSRLAICVLASKIAYVIFAFAFIKSEQDLLMLSFIYGVSQLLPSGISIILMMQKGYRPAWPGWAFTLRIGLHSTEFFWSRAAVATYSVGGLLYLGFVSTPTQVAFYSAAEQLYRGARALLTPLTQALYPHMVRRRDFKLLFSCVRWSILLCLIGLAIGLAIGDKIVILLFSQDFAEAENIFSVFLITLTISTPSVLLGYPMFGAIGKSSIANRSVMLAGIVQIGLLGLWYALGWTNGLNVSLVVLTVEIFVLTYRLVGLYKYRKLWNAVESPA